MKAILLPLFFIGLITNTFAQEAKKAWTLRECIDYAVANNLTVKRSTYNVETYDINADQAKLALAPTISANINGGYNWGRSVNPVTYAFTTAQNNAFSPSASASMTLFNGLRLQNNIKQTAHDYEASLEDLQKSKNDIMLTVVTYYTNVIFNKELFENAKFQLSSSQQQLEKIQKQVAAGSLAKSNELNQDATVATNELNVITRENAVNLSLLQLKQALQLPASAELDVVVPEINLEELVLDQTREEIYNIAYQNMPEIKSANLKVQSSYYSIKAARGNLYPRLSLNYSINSNYSSASKTKFVSDGGVKYVPAPLVVADGSNTPINQVTSTGTYQDIYGVKDQLKDNIFRSATVNLTIPIFNGLQTRAAVQRAVINKEVAEITSQQAANTLRQSVETAFNDALAASKTYNSSLRQVQAREEAFRMMKQKFDAGAATFIEYHVAENDMFQAKSDLLRAKYDFIFKKKLLDFYQNKPLDY